MCASVDESRSIDLLRAHEAAMADLYAAYAARFPECADLFSSLSEAERRHAQRIAAFVELVREGQASIDPKRFPTPALLASIEFVKECMHEVAAAGFTLLAALSVAHDLEEGLLESRYFDAATADSTEVRTLLRQLASDTAQHRSLVRAAWDKERGPSRMGDPSSD